MNVYDKDGCVFHDVFQLVYHGLQLAAFTVMAVAFMRLKLFWTPQMCLVTSLLACKQVRSSDAVTARPIFSVYYYTK